jgi:hypothetical protein
VVAADHVAGVVALLDVPEPTERRLGKNADGGVDVSAKLR